MSLGILFLILITGGGIYWYLHAPLFPSKEEGLAGIKLGFSEGDVKFFFGEPKEIEEKTLDGSMVLNMTADSHHYSPDDGDIRVFMKEGFAKEIQVICSSDKNVGSYNIQGVRCYDSYDTVMQKFGNPSFVSIHENEITRILSYEKYRVYFGFVNAKIRAFGVYDPSKYKEGARRLHNEKKEPTYTQEDQKRISGEVGKASAQEFKGPDSVVSISDEGCRAFLAHVKNRKDTTAQVKACRKQLGEK